MMSETWAFLQKDEKLPSRGMIPTSTILNENGQTLKKPKGETRQMAEALC